MGTSAPSLGADLNEIRRRISNLERSPRLGRSTVDSGELTIAGPIALQLNAASDILPGAKITFGPADSDDPWPNIRVASPPNGGGYAASALTLSAGDGAWVDVSGSVDGTDLLMAGRGVNAARLRFQGNRVAGEFRCLDTTSSYVPIRASSFPTGSSREIKQDVISIPFDTVKAIKAARAQQWAYKPEYASENGQRHIGPMAEDLPPALVTEVDGIKTVDLLSLVGTLWDAVGTIADRLDAIEAKLA